ncbi:hypothetical protein Q4I28_000664 [Leishmania naiffi]|uniref:Ribosome biogenesis protein SLX9 n=1 Tax=Leishmania naiffi TaxID=5678 RepID=A0AAW3C759_9TRYP
MTGGKLSKRVRLRAKNSRKQQAHHVSGEHAPPSSGLSSSPPPATPPTHSPTKAHRQEALDIRDALRQRRGRARPAAAMKVTGASSSRTTPGSGDAKRRLAKKAKKDTPSSQRTAGRRRATLLQQRRPVLPQMTAAEERMAVAQEELNLFDKVQTVPAYVADPFAAVMQHLSSTMDALQPQTPDVGPAERAVGAGRRR